MNTINKVTLITAMLFSSASNAGIALGIGNVSIGEQEFEFINAGIYGGLLGIDVKVGENSYVQMAELGLELGYEFELGNRFAIKPYGRVAGTALYIDNNLDNNRNRQVAGSYGAGLRASWSIIYIDANMTKLNKEYVIGKKAEEGVTEVQIGIKF